MAVIRPFRAWRADPTRLDPGALAFFGHVADDGAVDPRTLRRALRAGPGDNAPDEVVATRARFHIAELMRVALLRRDAKPALYVLRHVDGDAVRVGFFAAVRLDAFVIEPPAPDVAARPDGRIVAEAGVVGDAAVLGFTDKKGRVSRALETETDREPDVAFARGAHRLELWAVDDETSAERLTALVQAGDPRVRGGAAALSTVRSIQSANRAEEDAAAFGIGFFVDDEQDFTPPPSGIVLLPRAGPL